MFGHLRVTFGVLPKTNRAISSFWLLCSCCTVRDICRQKMHSLEITWCQVPWFHIGPQLWQKSNGMTGSEVDFLKAALRLSSDYLYYEWKFPPTRCTCGSVLFPQLQTDKHSSSATTQSVETSHWRKKSRLLYRNAVRSGDVSTNRDTSDYSWFTFRSSPVVLFTRTQTLQQEDIQEI